MCIFDIHYFPNGPSNCGSCDNACDLLNATPGCNNYNCVVYECVPGFADCDLIDASGCEVDILNDPDNCNGCGIVCEYPNAPAICVDGSCEQGDCSGEFQDCNLDPIDGCEVNTNTDEDNCGSCGFVCGDPAEQCVLGECRCGSVGENCSSAQACCGIECVETQTDSGHCGGCDVECQDGEECITGSCSCGGPGGPDCDPADICCGSDCYDPLDSVLHCGQCDNQCDTNELCTFGQCRCGGGSLDCSAPMSCCGLECVDLQTDEFNCGSCNTICNLPNSTYLCQSGGCVIISCDAGYTDCNAVTDDGCEIFTSGDVDNCGSCSNQCTNDNGTTQCLSGNCAPTCIGLFGDCDGNPDNGCETPLNTLTDCGGCNVACDLPNAGESCASGSCAITGCDPGYTDCNSQPGCETYTAGDVNNCGSCSNQCSNSHGSTECLAGACTPTCVGLWGNCDADPDDGCETPLDTLVNCGDCSVSCSLDHASESCATGSCQIDGCESGYTDCNSTDSDGCGSIIINITPFLFISAS